MLFRFNTPVRVKQLQNVFKPRKIRFDQAFTFLFQQRKMLIRKTDKDVFDYKMMTN